MGLSNEEIQLIEQAVTNEVYNLQQVADRYFKLDPAKAQDWVIKKRRLEIAMRELKRDYLPYRNWRHESEI